jgi:hypothetical protein
MNSQRLSKYDSSCFEVSCFVGENPVKFEKKENKGGLVSISHTTDWLERQVSSLYDEIVNLEVALLHISQKQDCTSNDIIMSKYRKIGSSSDIFLLVNDLSNRNEIQVAKRSNLHSLYQSSYLRLQKTIFQTILQIFNKLEKDLTREIKQNVKAKERYLEYSSAVHSLVQTEASLSEYLKSLLVAMQRLPVDKNPIIYITELMIHQRRREIDDFDLLYKHCCTYLYFETAVMVMQQQRLVSIATHVGELDLVKSSLKSHMIDLLHSGESSEEDDWTFLEIDLVDLYLDQIYEVVETSTATDTSALDLFIKLLEGEVYL